MNTAPVTIPGGTVASERIEPDRAWLIHTSGRCLLFGVMGLVPLAGLIPALLAFQLHRRLARETGEHWKLEWIYLTWVLGGASAGLLATLFHWTGFAGVLFLCLVGQYNSLGHQYAAQRPTVWNPARWSAFLGLLLAGTGVTLLVLVDALWLYLLYGPRPDAW